jgi:hypothetical protein
MDWISRVTTPAISPTFGWIPPARRGSSSPRQGWPSAPSRSQARSQDLPRPAVPPARLHRKQSRSSTTMVLPSWSMSIRMTIVPILPAGRTDASPAARSDKVRVRKVARDLQEAAMQKSLLLVLVGIVAAVHGPSLQAATCAEELALFAQQYALSTEPRSGAAERPPGISTAKRAQMQRLLDEARTASRQGRAAECFERLSEARAIPEPG